ncbi:MAG: ParB N-terminal domain-containing protein [Bacteroidales bacterium]|jgi:ParB family chromosome partitioning protein
MKALEKLLLYISPKQISPDINNPRGENKEMILSDPSFRSLLESIKRYGVLEPLIVKRIDKNSYLLIDGERRYWASIEARLKEIPVLTAKNEADGRILAYQVHMLRKQWNKVAETKSIKQIILEIEKKSPKLTEVAIKKKIIEITKASNARINDIFKIIKYDDDIIEKSILGNLKVSYLVQIDASFVNRIKIYYPNILKTFSENQIRKIIIDKALHHLMDDTRYLIKPFNEVFQYNNQKESIENLLLNFIKDKSKDIKIAYNEFLAIKESDTKTQESKKGINKKNKKKNSKQNIKPSTDQDNLNYSPIKLVKKLQIKIDDIQPKYEYIGSTFTKEEKEYIKEAIYCLKNHCFKASVLMIWSTGVSRILKYIEKDIADFNKCSSEMKKKPDSFFKFYSAHFKTDYLKIENIRNDSRDMHLLCYLCYKQIITVPSFDKLQSNYKTRCNCAHPTSITLEVNETVAIFENIFDLILNNKKIK